MNAQAKLETDMAGTKISKVAGGLIRPQIDEILDAAKTILTTVLRVERRNAVLETRLEESGKGVNDRLDFLEKQIKGFRDDVTKGVKGEMRAVPPKPGSREGSYAHKVRGKSIVEEEGSFFAVIKSAEGKKALTADEIKCKLKEDFRPADSGWQVAGIRRRGPDKLEIRTPNEMALNRIINDKRLVEKGLVASKTGGRDPKVVVYDVPRDRTDGEIMDFIRTQNFAGAKEFENPSWSASYRTGPRNREDGKTNIVLTVSPTIRNLLLERGRLYVDWDRCRVTDFVGVSRCYRCHQYGHTARRGCKVNEGVIICTYCGGRGHKRAECPAKLKGEAPCCPSCNAVGKKADHDTLDRSCPAYQAAHRRWVELTRYE